MYNYEKSKTSLSIPEGESMKILITGHLGFLGSRLLQELSKSHETYTNTLYINDDNYVYYNNWLCELQPDVIIHCAAETNAKRCEIHHDLAYEKNIIATQILVRIAKTINSLFIFISSDQVYHRFWNNGYESEICYPETYYGYTKLKGEQEVLEHLSDFYILRLSMQLGLDTNTLGKNRNQLIMKLIHKAKNDKTIICDKDCFRSYTYVYDTIDFIGYLLDSTLPSGIYNVSSECIITISDVYKYILKKAHFSEDRINSLICESVVKEPYDMRMNNSKLVALSKRLPSLIVGIDRCMKGYVNLEN